MKDGKISRRTIWPLGYFEGQYVKHGNRTARVVGLCQKTAKMVSGDCVPIVYDDTEYFCDNGRPGCKQVPAEDLSLLV